MEPGQHEDCDPNRWERYRAFFDRASDLRCVDIKFQYRLCVLLIPGYGYFKLVRRHFGYDHGSRTSHFAKQCCLILLCLQHFCERLFAVDI